MNAFIWIQALFEYLGGAREESPAGASILERAWLIGLWWGVLAIAVLFFCGQTSKFIYIDF